MEPSVCRRALQGVAGKAISRSPVRDGLVEEHSVILDAALAGDADTAVARLIDHYRYSVEIVLGCPVGLSKDNSRFVVEALGDSEPD